MKTFNISIGLLAVAMAIMVQQLDGVSNPLKSSIFTRALVSCQAKMAFLQAGYEYTQEEKDNAREEIVLLEGQQAAIWKQYNEINARQDLSTQEKDEHVHSIALSMYRLSEDIKELQLITGDAWSDDRKRAWGFVALIAAGLVTYKFFGPSVIALVKKDRKNSDKLGKKQKEQEQQLEQQQQQKQLLDEKIAKEAKDQRNIEKAQRKAAEKKVKQEAEEKVKQEKANKKIEKKIKKSETQIEFQKQLEERVKKQAEQAQREKVEKERAQESLIINKNVIEAQERVNDIEKEIIEIKNLYKDGGEVDQNNVDRLQLLQEKLPREQDALQNCILKAKVNHFESEQRLIAARKKLADQRKQDQRDWALNMSKKLVIAITKASVKAAKIMAQLTKDGFMALKARSRLSDEDQKAIVRGLY